MKKILFSILLVVSSLSSAEQKTSNFNVSVNIIDSCHIYNKQKISKLNNNFLSTCTQNKIYNQTTAIEKIVILNDAGVVTINDNFMITTYTYF